VAVGTPHLERVSTAPARNARVRSQVPETMGWFGALGVIATVFAFAVSQPRPANA
jgi:hypothetical protein